MVVVAVVADVVVIVVADETSSPRTGSTRQEQDKTIAADQAVAVANLRIASPQSGTHAQVARVCTGQVQAANPSAPAGGIAEQFMG